RAQTFVWRHEGGARGRRAKSRLRSSDGIQTDRQGSPPAKIQQPGVSGLRIDTGDPHSLQKPRRIVPPLSVLMEWYLSSFPLNFNRSLGTTSSAAKALPLARWQSRQ